MVDGCRSGCDGAWPGIFITVVVLGIVGLWVWLKVDAWRSNRRRPPGDDDL
jgi:hypothetical protein